MKRYVVDPSRHVIATAGLAAVAAALVVTARYAPAADRPAAQEEIVYVKPKEAGSGARVNGKVRGSASDLPDVYILSPDHVGLTIREQPSIFCYLTKPTKVPLRVTITSDGEVEPVVERDLDAGRGGIVRLDLKGKERLQPDVQYTVTFALKPEPGHGAKDVVATGMIKRVKPPASLVAKLMARADPLDRAVACAREGIWYDALAILSDEIEPPHNNKALRKQRAALLDQVALADAASFDRSAER
jgi:hypothetical protein